ncbi:uncharacterized protein DS421_1g30340 [Arachis hypogaea]|nr:uncharacterized protein DS421_1g30340 [Arachis hypogaea]
MKVSDSAGNDPKQPCLTSELQPPRNMNEANRKNDDHDTTALNLDLTMDVSIEARLMAIEQLIAILDVRVARTEALIVYIKMMLSTLCKKEEKFQMIPTPKVQVQDEAMDMKIAQPPNTPGCIATAAAVVLNNSNIGAPGQMFTHQLTSSQKGKGILGDPITNLSLDVVAPDSSGSEDHLVLLDHLSSTPVISTGATLILTDAPTSLH